MQLNSTHSIYPSFLHGEEFVFALGTQYFISARQSDYEFIRVRLTVRLLSGRAYGVDFKHAIEAAIWNPGNAKLSQSEIEQQIAEIAKLEIGLSDDGQKIVFELSIDRVYRSGRTPNLCTFTESDYYFTPRASTIAAVA